MNEKLRYPEEIFAWRQKRYQATPRTKLPADQQAETALRVNRLVHRVTAGLRFPDDFLASRQESAGGDRVPANLFNLEFQYNGLTDCLVVTGSGGSVVLDSSHCMVDVARFFLDAAVRESCGECTFCRIGTQRMLEIVERVCTGSGRPDDLPILADLADKVAASSLCEVGKLASSPVQSTLKHFSSLYEEHIQGRCRTAQCGLAGRKTKGS